MTISHTHLKETNNEGENGNHHEHHKKKSKFGILLFECYLMLFLPLQYIKVTPREIVGIVLRVVGLLTCLYFFVVSLNLMSSSFPLLIGIKLLLLLEKFEKSIYVVIYFTKFALFSNRI